MDDFVINLDTITGINENGGYQNAKLINQIIVENTAESSLIIVSNLDTADGLINDGTIGLDPTTLIINGPLTGTGIIQISQASTLELNGSVSAGETIQFVSTNANLILGDPSEFSGTINSFLIGDTIDITTIPFLLETISLNDNTLSLIGQDDSLLTSLNFDVGVSPSTLQLSSDGMNGSEITMACFLKGTQISTRHKKIFVQDLKIGDKIITLDGSEHKIKWIGYRTYRQPYKLSDRGILPVCISKSALKKNVPSSDLFLSQEHSIFVENILVPVRYLINEKTIRIVDTFDEISYFHIELESHNIIFAEDMPVETFVDSGYRKKFENYSEYLQMYPENDDHNWTFCYPKIQDIRQAHHIRKKILGNVDSESETRYGQLNGRFEGFLDYACRNQISGWAWLPERSDLYVDLDVFVDHGLVARISADRYRSDLLNAKIGNGFHGFDLTFFPPLVGASHLIDIKFAGNHQSLARCPMIITQKSNATPPTRRPSVRSSTKIKSALFIDSVWPDRQRDAASNAILDHVRLFQKMGYHVDFVATDKCPDGVAEEFSKLGIQAKTHLEHPTVESLLQSPEAKYSFIYLHRLDIARRYAGLIRSISRNEIGGPTKKIYSLADLQCLRIMREAVVKRDESLKDIGRSLFFDELLVLSQVDAVITHSHIEASIIKKKLPHLNLNVIPWSLRTRAIRTPFSIREGIGFLGSFEHSPNRDAVGWLLSDIMPALWRTKPHIRLKVFGAGWSRLSLPRLDSRVDIIGEVDDLFENMKNLRATVAPLRFGAGIKGKVLDSLAFGIPCVMTSYAAEGIHLEDGYYELIDDNPSGIADKLADVHSDEIINVKYSKIGHDIIKRSYNEKTVFGLMTDIFRNKAQSGRGYSVI